jgi:uroporphyrinogen-III synthase
MTRTRPPTGPILITRSRDDAADWVRELSARGFDAIVLPCITTERIDTPAVRDELARAQTACDWIVFTSRRGVAAFVDLRGGPSGSAAPDAVAPLPASIRIAAVGPATASACEARLGRVDLVADESIGDAQGGTAAALAEHLVARLGKAGGATVLLPLAANAGDLLERRFAAAGAHPVRVEVYRTVPAPPLHPKRALSTLGADNIFLASPSAVTGFVNQVEVDVAAGVYTIGPSTSARARAVGLEISREATVPSLEGLLEAMQWTS